MYFFSQNFWIQAGLKRCVTGNHFQNQYVRYTVNWYASIETKLYGIFLSHKIRRKTYVEDANAYENGEVDVVWSFFQVGFWKGNVTSINMWNLEINKNTFYRTDLPPLMRIWFVYFVRHARNWSITLNHPFCH